MKTSVLTVLVTALVCALSTQALAESTVWSRTAVRDQTVDSASAWVESAQTNAVTKTVRTEVFIKMSVLAN